MGKSRGIVTARTDSTLENKTKNLGLGLVIAPDMPMSFDKVLFVDPGIKVPWDLLNAAWHFLERWDAAIPLYRYGVTAEDVGTADERKATKAIVRDLRVLLHCPELLFVRNNPDGRNLLEKFKEEMENGKDKRLAFLRAFYLTKPRVCILPTSWLHETYQRSQQDTLFHRGKRKRGQQLVTVEISPGHFVKCNPGDEDKIIQQLSLGGRRGQQK